MLKKQRKNDTQIFNLSNKMTIQVQCSLYFGQKFYTNVNILPERRENTILQRYVQWIPLDMGTVGPVKLTHVKRLFIKTEVSKYAYIRIGTRPLCPH